MFCNGIRSPGGSGGLRSICSCKAINLSHRLWQAQTPSLRFQRPASASFPGTWRCWARVVCLGFLSIALFLQRAPPIDSSQGGGHPAPASSGRHPKGQGAHLHRPPHQCARGLQDWYVDSGRLCIARTRALALDSRARLSAHLTRRPGGSPRRRRVQRGKGARAGQGDCTGAPRGPGNRAMGWTGI